MRSAPLTLALSLGALLVCLLTAPAGLAQDCLTNVDCDDGGYCNGVETCDPVTGCQSGLEPCTDTVYCTQDTCNETADSCSYEPDDYLCDDGLFCTGTETCDFVLGCQPGIPVECSPDNDPCRDMVCREEVLGCDLITVNDGGPCDDGNACTQADVCDFGDCVGETFCSQP
jgi:hypothetical protein